MLFSTILDKKGDEPYLEILTNIDHLSQANYILEQMGYQPRQLEDAQPKKEQTPARPENSSFAKAKEWLDAGDDFDQFWEKSETAPDAALMLYLLHEARLKIRIWKPFCT
ncbi:MAG: hypothetical protein V8T01_08080 [Oscillospiraceae bacterium]